VSSSDPAERPEPKEDAPPDEGPGGPADMIHHDEDDMPLATSDQPRSAQVEEKHVPDEIEQAEEVDEEEKDVDPGTEEPA
jgi:hypothetical protein